MNRVLLKTTTYGLMHLTVAVAVTFALTRDWRVALAVGIVEPIVQTFAFAIHERFWSRAGDVPVVPICGHTHGPPSGLSRHGASPARPETGQAGIAA